MKKVISFLLIMLIISLPAYASEDKYALRQVKAMIDDTPIECWTINGHTYINVEDLCDYGFDVTYDVGTKTYNVKRNKFETPVYTRRQWEADVLGGNEEKVVDNGKKVMLDGNLATTFGTETKTLMMIDELVRYGTCKWSDKTKTVSVSLFSPELNREFENAENKVEKIYEYERFFNTYKVKYIGQVNERGVPHGIGKATIDRDGWNEFGYINYLGYFTDGRPNGALIRWESYSTSRSYSGRSSTFYGIADDSKTAKRQSLLGVSMISAGPEFGIRYIPRRSLPLGTEVEFVFDDIVYGRGIYYESYYCKNDAEQCRIWYDGETYQTETEKIDEWRQENVLLKKSGENKGENDKIEEFIEYTNGEKSYYNGRVNGTFYPFDIKVMLGEKEVKYTDSVMRNDRVLIPARTLFEKMGATVEWEAETSKVLVTKEDTIIIVQIDNNTMTVNGKETVLDVPPMLINDKTYVPLRAITEGLNAGVAWDENLKTVHINP